MSLQLIGFNQLQKATEESTGSMMLQWIGFFFPKIIDLMHFLVDSFLLN